MTVSGSIAEADVPLPGRLVPASKAQAYVAGLEAELAKLDGSPVFFIDDGESGTSEELVMEANEAALEGRPIADLPIVVLMERCIRNGWSFRVWLADSDPGAHLRRVDAINDLKSAIAAIAKSRGVCWHAS